jgi:hypothetical protein
MGHPEVAAKPEAAFMEVLALVRSAISVQPADLSDSSYDRTTDFDAYHKTFLAAGAHWDPAKQMYVRADGTGEIPPVRLYPTFAWNAGSLTPLHVRMEIHRDDPERVSYWILVNGIDAKKHKLRFQACDASSKAILNAQDFATNVNENPGLKGADTEAIGSGFQLAPATRVFFELSLGGKTLRSEIYEP